MINCPKCNSHPLPGSTNQFFCHSTLVGGGIQRTDTCLKLEAELNLSEVVSHLCFITNAHKISSTAIQLTINDQPIMWTKDEGRIFHILMDHFNTIELEG